MFPFWKAQVLRGRALYRRVRHLQLPLYAANAGFFLILASFPALLLLLSILRYTPLRLESLLSLLEGFLPDALYSWAAELIRGAYDHASGAAIGLSAVTAVWSASRGIWGLLQGLEAVYGRRGHRGYVRERLVSLGYTLLLFPVILATLMLHVFGSTLIRWLSMLDAPLLTLLDRWIGLRFLLLLSLQSLVFTVLLRTAPGSSLGFRQSLPGGVTASLGWLIFSDLYSIYVENFSRYANIYGSVYALALSMLWLYICLSILFYAAVLNRVLAEGENVDFL